jgi:hypothetical protein
LYDALGAQTDLMAATGRAISTTRTSNSAVDPRLLAQTRTTAGLDGAGAMNRTFVKYWHEVRIGLAIALLLLCLYKLLIRI